MDNLNKKRNLGVYFLKNSEIFLDCKRPSKESLRLDHNNKRQHVSIHPTKL